MMGPRLTRSQFEQLLDDISQKNGLTKEDKKRLIAVQETRFRQLLILSILSEQLHTEQQKQTYIEDLFKIWKDVVRVGKILSRNRLVWRRADDEEQEEKELKDRSHKQYEEITPKAKFELKAPVPSFDSTGSLPFADEDFSDIASLLFTEWPEELDGPAIKRLMQPVIEQLKILRDLGLVSHEFCDYLEEKINQAAQSNDRSQAITILHGAVQEAEKEYQVVAQKIEQNGDSPASSAELKQIVKSGLNSMSNLTQHLEKQIDKHDNGPSSGPGAVG